MIIIFRNLRKKVLFLAAFIFLWLAIFLLSHLAINNIPVSEIAIDEAFSFSFPLFFSMRKIYFNEHYEETISVNSLITDEPLCREFSTYITLKGRFSFEYPSIFTLDEKDFPDSDIIFHLDFNDNKEIIRGFVQVWDLPYSLKQFLDESKENSTLQFKNFKFEELNVEGKEGYLWDYTVISNMEEKPYKSMEFFFKEKDRMYRISYFVPPNQWNKTNKDIFWNMVKSFKVY